MLSPSPNRHRSRLRSRQGFTLIEALIATGLLGFSLVVMFGFHSQAVRSNKHARKMTNCTYLAQTYLERLLSVPWNASVEDDYLSDGATDATADGSNDNLWVFLENSTNGNGVDPTPVNAGNSSTDSSYGAMEYYISWDVDNTIDTEETWALLRVRCQYYDDTFGQWKGTTVSSFRFRDYE